MFVKEDKEMLIETTNELNGKSFASRMTQNINDLGCEWAAGYSVPVTKNMFAAITSYLVHLRNKEDGSYAVVLHNEYKNEESNVIFAAVLEKHTAEEGKSYSLSFTFDDNDIPADAKRISITDTAAVEFISQWFNKNPLGAGNNRYTYMFSAETIDANKFSVFISFRGAVITLQEFARDNVMNEDKKWEFKGCFTLTADVAEDGKVFVKIIPSEELKQRVKDDSSLEKNEDGAITFAA